MKREITGWQKLVVASRGLRDERSAAAPYGFSTRVAAQAWASAASSGSALWERVSWRALGIASLLAVVGLAANYATYSRSVDDDLMPDDGTVAAILDVS
jgi:hypothetical protein